MTPDTGNPDRTADAVQRAGAAATKSPRRLRILHCLPWIAGGGVERRRLSLIKLLDPERYEQRMLIRSTKGKLIEQYRAAGIVVVEVGNGRLFDPRLMARSLRAGWQFKPDIVHGAVFEGVATAVVVGRATGARVIVEETSHATNRTRSGHALFRTLVALADTCVAISPAVGDYLVQETKVPRAKVRVITNGVARPAPPSGPPSAMREAFGLPPDVFVVGTICRLMDDGHKRVSDLLRALTLLGDLSDLRLLVVGDGKERPMLEALAQELGVAERVRFTGYRMDTGNAFAAMDVFALVSSREGFGLAVAEAMFAGCPVLATGVGGILDIVLDGQTGLLVPPCEPPKIAEAIRRLYASPELRASLGAAGRVRADAEFSAERYARDVDTLYRELAP